MTKKRKQNLGDYSSGQYLHRKYLLYNPAIINAPTRQKSEFRTKLRESIQYYRELEDEALINFSSAMSGTAGSVEDGWSILQELLEASKGPRDAILGILFDYFNKKNAGRTTIKDINAYVVKVTQNMLAGQYPENDNSQLQKEVTQFLNDNIRGISEAKGGRRGRLAIATPTIGTGNIMEIVDTALFKVMLTKKLEEAGGSNLFLDTLFLGKQKIKFDKNQTNLQVQSSYDILINLSDGLNEIKLPISLKTKTTGGSESNILVEKKIKDLLDWAKEDTAQEFMREALINQHYWGYGPYKSKVLTALQSDGMLNQRNNPSNASSYAIEEMDTRGVIKALEPAIDLLRNALLVNLVVGFDEAIPNLFTIIVGDTFGGKYKGKSALIRSSEILEDFYKNYASSPEDAALFFSKTKYSSKKLPIDSDIIKEYDKRDLTSREWQQFTDERGLGDILENTYIRTELNYGLLLED